MRASQGMERAVFPGGGTPLAWGLAACLPRPLAVARRPAFVLRLIPGVILPFRPARPGATLAPPFHPVSLQEPAVVLVQRQRKGHIHRY
jgi:hypothetical protein